MQSILVLLLTLVEHMGVEGFVPSLVVAGIDHHDSLIENIPFEFARAVVSNSLENLPHIQFDDMSS